MKIPNANLIVLLVCSLAVTTGPVIAQQNSPSANVKFAVVNFQKIFREAAATRSVAPQIAKLKKSFEVQFKDFQTKLQAAERDLKNQRTILSPEPYAQKQEAFKKQVNGVQRNVQAAQRMVGLAQDDAYKSVRQAFYRITQEVAKERSLEVVFPRSGLIHVDAKYDISDEVLKRLNKVLPSVKVKLPTAGEGQAGASSRKKK
ncbi:MAG: OmpH family outer membrane protein [Proteobacteria bacterium]|nr:OmpH family outer membrane protein [Pseudomonadota bacterium]